MAGNMPACEKRSLAELLAVLIAHVLLPAGSPQQQTAAAGALQSLALQVEHHTAFMQCGAVPALVDMMGRQHVALASAAAGALCNLSLGSTQDKVSLESSSSVEPGRVCHADNGVQDKVSCESCLSFEPAGYALQVMESTQDKVSCGYCFFC